MRQLTGSSHLSWSSTILYQLPPSTTIHSILPVQFTCLSSCLYNLCRKSSLVYLLLWHLPLHTPYTSSSNNCLLFTTHAHTIATCFPVIRRLCHLIIVCLSTLYLELFYLNVTHPSDHSHLCLLKCPFSFLTGQVSLPCNILYYSAHNCSTVSLSLSVIYPYW